MKGGARPGAGRKKGIPNKNPRKKVEARSSIGPMPAEMMLEIARYHYRKAQELKAKPAKDRDELEIRSEHGMTVAAADKVAKFYHPALATLQSNVNLTGRLTLEQLVEASLPAPANSNEAVKLIEGDKVDAAE